MKYNFDDFSEEYIELIENNSIFFDDKILNIFKSTKHSFNKVIGLQNGFNSELEFFIQDNELFLEKIIARGKGKQIMFLVIFFALKNNLKFIKLKAEPLNLIEGEKFSDRQRYLKDFYGYFGFGILNLFSDMSLELEEYNVQNLIIVLNRLKLFLENK